MTHTDIINRPLRCKCGHCADAVQDILRMERMLCQGGRTEMARRRNRIRRMKRSARDRERYYQRRAS